MLLSGTILQNRYLIKDRIGEGGMGAVYRALDQEFDAIVAVKETLCDDTAMREQFKREATILYKLRHPSLPCVTNHFSEGTGQFLVMDYVEGDDLMAVLTQNHGPIPVNQVISWAEELLDTIEYLHSEKIIHRDLKPQNIKQTAKGNIMLLDFGLAKLQHTFSLGSASIHAATLSYAPLEQIRGYGTGPRSDIYSLAATLYHLITNEIPKNAEVREGVLDHGAPDPLKPAHLHNPDVPIGFSRALQQAMGLHAETRPDNIAEFRKMLFADQAAEVTKAGRKNSASLAANDRSGYTTITGLPNTGEPDLPIKARDNRTPVIKPRVEIAEPKPGQITAPASNRKKKIIFGMVGVLVLAIAAIIIFRPFPFLRNRGMAAIVNGRGITLRELDREFRLENASQTVRPTGDALESARRAALDELIGKELMFQMAVENKLRVNDMEIDQAVDRQKLESGLSEEQWELRNRDQGMSEGDIHEEMRRALTIKQMEQQIVATVRNPTEREINDYYDQNPEKFNQLPKNDPNVRKQISQLLLADRQKAAIAEAKAEALKRADVINFLKRPQ